MIKRKFKIIEQFQTIRGSIMFSFSMLIVVALSVFLIISLTYTETTVFGNSITFSKQIINQINGDLDSYIENMENISSILVESKDVQAYLEPDVEEKYLVETRSRIIAQIETVMSSRNDIANIALLSQDGTVIINDGEESLNPSVSIEDKKWYQQTINDEEGEYVSTPHVQNLIRSSYEWVITLSHIFRNQETNEINGFFFVDLNYEAISELCNDNKIGERGYVYIVDDQGEIIYHPKQQLLYGGLLEEKTTEILEVEDYTITDEGKDSRLYTVSKSSKTNWTVVGVSYTSELLKYNDTTVMIYIIVALGLLIAVLIVSNIVAQLITRPISELHRSMDKVEQGLFEEASIEVENNNEVGKLSRSFNEMTEKIQFLMEENVKEQREKRKSELRALQAQINPHFLYNTLDSIVWMSAANKNDEVVEMTAALAKLFRQSISNEREIITIREEVDYVRSYLTIQKMRYKDKVDFEIEVEENLLNDSIMKLTLQPLVENAIYHGLKYKKEKGHLLIRAFKEDKIYLKVIDNGAGMSEEQLKTIFEKKENEKNNGIGVANVQNRLRLLYGKEYGIVYESELGIGTVATVCIPIDGGKYDE